MNKKNLMTAGLVAFGTFVLVAANGCSSDESTGSSSSAFSCPAVGSKACPNDEAVTQAVYDLCKKCETEFKASASCNGGGGSASCGADGKSTSSGTSSDPNKCKAESDAVGKCIANALTGGADAGG